MWYCSDTSLRYVNVKGNLLQNNNKKICFLKTYSLLRIEVFYKRIEDTKGKSPWKTWKRCGAFGIRTADQWIVWSLIADRLQKGEHATDGSTETSYKTGQFFHYILLRNYGSRLVVCMFKPKQSLESWANCYLSNTRFFSISSMFYSG